MKILEYRRAAAADYAERWALSRNPAYYSFDGIGGDCTNFVSQCVFAGCGVMNWEPVTGWYYAGLNYRAPAWTGVVPFGRFLLTNTGPGPFARQTDLSSLEQGDVIQLGNSMKGYYHTLLVLESTPDRTYIASHSRDALWRPLDSYKYDSLRCLKILGARSA